MAVINHMRILQWVFYALASIIIVPTYWGLIRIKRYPEKPKMETSKCYSQTDLCSFTISNTSMIIPTHPSSQISFVIENKYMGWDTRYWISNKIKNLIYPHYPYESFV